MAEFKKYPSIEQFRNVVRNVRQWAKHNNEPLPKIMFFGTIKLHGTNAAIVYDPATKDIQCQSRNNFITVDNDNAGFAAWVEERKYDLLLTLNDRFGHLDTPTYIYGEFCGGNIQKGVGINGLDKMFVIFNATVDGVDCLPISAGIGELTEIKGIYSTFQFEFFSGNVDFSNPEIESETFRKLTLEIEKECPVAKHFGVDNGTGEGIVWQSKELFNGKRLSFKVKGEKHSVSKVKTIAAVDVEKVASVAEFIDKVVTENRLEQGLREVFGDNEPDIKQTGAFLKWVGNDVFKEESDTLEESGLTRKDVGGKIADKARQWFMNRV